MDTTNKLSDNEGNNSTYTDFSDSEENTPDIETDTDTDNDNESTNSSSEKPDDIDSGEIYLIKCTKTNLYYVGQAKKYKSNLQKWGGKSRCNQHFSTAYRPNASDYNGEFHKAIREHGKESFTLKILCTCHKNELNELEQLFIKKYNTLHPNGYNMTEGGSNGKHCEESNRKKQIRNTDFSEEAKENMSKGQIGKRYDTKIPRKNEEDNDLPKNIAAIRREGVLLGYQVKKFPMGIDTKEYIYKTFKNKAHPEIALEKAKEHLEILKKEYEQKVKDKEEKDSIEQVKEMKLPKFPDNLYPFVKDMKLIGYYVKGLNDFNNNLIPTRKFINCTLNVNYEHATKFLNLVKVFNEEKETPKDWLTLEILKKEYVQKVKDYNEEKDSIEQSKELKLPKFPDNLYPFVKDMKLIGYYVKGLTDFNSNFIPTRKFINCTLNINYEHATKFLNLVKEFNDKKETPKDWLTVELPKYTRDETLPKYIRKLMLKGEESGYRVDYYIGFVNNEQIIQSKAFTSRKLNMDQKLELAKKYVEELDKQHKQTE